MITDKDEAREHLKELNDKVEQAIQDRKDFLDEHASLFADFKIGEEVINIQTGEWTTVKRYYRMHRDSNVYYDNSLRTECEFTNGDNTSRYGIIHPYKSKNEYALILKRKLEELDGKTK